MAFLNVGKHNIRLLAKVKISHRRFPRGEIHWRGDPDEADKKEEKEEVDKKQVQLYSRVQQGLPSDKKLTTQYVCQTLFGQRGVEYWRRRSVCTRTVRKRRRKARLVNNISGGKNVSGSR